jgi:hypothetical protein
MNVACQDQTRLNAVVVETNRSLYDQLAVALPTVLNRFIRTFGRQCRSKIV